MCKQIYVLIKNKENIITICNIMMLTLNPCKSLNFLVFFSSLALLIAVVSGHLLSRNITEVTASMPVVIVSFDNNAANPETPKRNK